MKNRSQAKTILLALFSALFAMAATAQGASPIRILGAGATFPYPLYSKWFSVYQKVDASILIDYQSIGSGAGIRQLTEGSVDFGASDAPMTDEQISKLKIPAFHIPTVMGAVVVSYNIPGLTKDLRLTPGLVTSLFNGEID